MTPAGKGSRHRGPGTSSGPAASNTCKTGAAMRAAALDYLGLPEPELVAFARAGDRQAFRAIMTRCNQRLFRIARAVVRDEAESEVATWLTRIVLNEAHGRLRRRKATVDLDQLEAAQESAQVLSFPGMARS